MITQRQQYFSYVSTEIKNLTKPLFSAGPLYIAGPYVSHEAASIQT